MKYRKKPVVIDAWKANDIEEDTAIPEWVFNAFSDRRIGETGKEGFDYYVNTLEGKLYFSVGDYLVRGVDGELYAVKKSIFEKTYESVE